MKQRFVSDRKLKHNLATANTYDDWLNTATQFDTKHQKVHWRSVDYSRRYDYSSIRSRLENLREQRHKQDNHDLLFTLNEGIHGNMGGMGSASLYNYALSGTKVLVEQYINEIAEAIEYIASDEVSDITLEEKMDFLHRAAHCNGRTALLMSGAGTLLYFHVGVVKALAEHNLLPSILSGASGGALVAAVACTHTSDQYDEVFAPTNTVLDSLKTKRSLFDLFTIERVDQGEAKELLERLIPDITFQEAYELTGLHLNITVSPAELHQTSRLLNAFTSPNVLIRSAVEASCAVPGIFPPVTLMAKNVEGITQAYLPDRKWVDGSLSQDLPIKRLSRLYGVNHTIVSQTNPLVLPFINEHKRPNSLLGIARQTLLKTSKELAIGSAKILQKSLKHESLPQKLINGTASILAQNYTGDINILPNTRIHNWLSLLTPRSEAEIARMIQEGKRATWPQLERIRLQTKISRSIYPLLDKLEHEIIAEASTHPNKPLGVKL